MTAKFWDERAQKYNDDIEKHDAVYMQTIESTKSLLSISDVVLDPGCASGELSLLISHPAFSASTGSTHRPT